MVRVTKYLVKMQETQKGRVKKKMIGVAGKVMTKM